MSEQIIQLLVAEKNRLDRAIKALQGSPEVVDVYDDPTMPDWVKPASKQAPVLAAPKKRKVGAAARRKMAAAQRRRWAAVKQAEEAAPIVKNKSLAAALATPPEETEFKSKMPAAMKASWAKRKAAAKKKAAKTKS